MFSNKNSNKPQVSNKDFLMAVFNNPPENLCAWVASYDVKPQESGPEHWAGHYLPVNSCPEMEGSNNYFSTALFSRSQYPLKRQLSCAEGMYCVVLDDLKETPLKPSWSLETSPSNHQLGFILKEPIRDMDLAKRLLTEISQKSLVNGNDKSGNNPIRYVRLPVGSNTKYETPFKHVIHEWHPNLRYTLAEIIETLNLNEEFILKGIKPARDAFEGLVLGNDIADLTRQILQSEHYYEPLLKFTSHLIAMGNQPKSVIAQAQGVMEAIEDKPADWHVYYNKIPSMVGGAYAKFAASGLDEKPSLEWLKEYFKDYAYSDEVPVATNFVIDGFLSDEIFAIAGAPGTGKSSMLFQLAMAAAHLCPADYELKPILRRKVVYLTEDARQAENILFGMKRWGGVTASSEEMHDWFSVIEVRRIKPEFLEAFIEWKVSEKTVIQEGENGRRVGVPPLIVFDTAAATFDLENESDNSEVSDAISHVKHACSANNTPLWIVAHSSKAQRNDTEDIQIRGASAWTGDVHGTAYIFAEAGLPSRYMRLRKRRFEADFEELEFTTETHSIMVQHALGHMVDKSYRVGYCKRSSVEERQLKQQIAKDMAAKEKMRGMHDQIIKQVDLLISEGAKKVSKRSIHSGVTGQSKVINQQIDYLVTTGQLTKHSDGKLSIELVPNDVRGPDWP
jgi:hypothetical protein